VGAISAGTSQLNDCATPLKALAPAMGWNVVPPSVERRTACDVTAALSSDCQTIGNTEPPAMTSPPVGRRSVIAGFSESFSGQALLLRCRPTR